VYTSTCKAADGGRDILDQNRSPINSTLKFCRLIIFSSQTWGLKVLHVA